MYWESSSRPLSVKTIWTNGRRHVVLNASETISELKHKKRGKYNRFEHVDHLKITRKCQNPSKKTSESSLRVSSYELRDEGRREKRVEVRERVRYRMTPDVFYEVCPAKEVSSRCFNDTVRFGRGFGCGSEREGRVESVICREPTEMVSTEGGLSERVMLWLDLAGMKEEDEELVVVEEKRKRVQTADCVKKVKSTRVEGEGGKKGAFRRELHIFLPKLPKKISECSSTLTTLSSKNSVIKGRQ